MNLRLGMILKLDTFENKITVLDIGTNTTHLKKRAKEMQIRCIKNGNGGLFRYIYKSKYLYVDDVSKESYSPDMCGDE